MLANSAFKIQRNISNSSKSVDVQCQILEQCIEDVKTNSRKYHVYFMLQTINYGSVREIEQLNSVSTSLATKLVHERQKGIFVNANQLVRVGLSRDMIEMLVKTNT